MAKKSVYPAVGTVADVKAMKKVIKGMTMEQLTGWVTELKVEYKTCEDQSILRMRLAMAIKAVHFPETAVKPKEKSKYADYSLEDLVGLASEHSVPVEVTDNERILRMRTIMALRAHKVIV